MKGAQGEWEGVGGRGWGTGEDAKGGSVARMGDEWGEVGGARVGEMGQRWEGAKGSGRGCKSVGRRGQNREGRTKQGRGLVFQMY